MKLHIHLHLIHLPMWMTAQKIVILLLKKRISFYGVKSSPKQSKSGISPHRQFDLDFPLFKFSTGVTM